jgi:uncharacterized protein GlcG (DUF336 family)
VMIFGGGVPIWLAGQTVGAVGVSGGSNEQDTACAQAGAEALTAISESGREVQ